MKTLDEVIKAQERCATYPNCHFCYLHAGPVCEWIRDALHYLKEYQGYLIGRDISEAFDEAFTEIYNSPLTWDELRTMEGKPVWVEDNIDEPEDTTKYWAIYRRIEKAQETEYALLSEFYYDKAQYGKTWQAYRKERK